MPTDLPRLVKPSQPVHYYSDLGPIARLYFGIEWIRRIAREDLSVQDEGSLVRSGFSNESYPERPDTAERSESCIVAEPLNYGYAD